MPNTRLVVPELAAVDVRGITRSAFLLRSALAAGAIYGGAAVTPFVRQAIAQEAEGESGDVDILNFAYTLEVLEQAFYEMALTEVKGLSGDLKELTTELRDNETEHVSVLTTMIRNLGGEPVPDPEVDFGDAFASVEKYLALAQTFEDTGVSAYNGAAPQIKDKKLLAAAGTIVQIEGRHAALIRFKRGVEIAPRAFDDALERGEVLRAVDPFIV